MSQLELELVLMEEGAPPDWMRPEVAAAHCSGAALAFRLHAELGLNFAFAARRGGIEVLERFGKNGPRLRREDNLCGDGVRGFERKAEDDDKLHNPAYEEDDETDCSGRRWIRDEHT